MILCFVIVSGPSQDRALSKEDAPVFRPSSLANAIDEVCR